MILRTVFFLGLLFAMAPSTTTAQLQPAQLFSDGVVLQRNVEVPVWGTAAPGLEVTVAFDGDTERTTTDASGQWQVTFAPRSAGGPHVLSVHTARDTVRMDDVLMGDVWVASGQSNMEWVVADAMNAEEEIASADDPEIRHFDIPHSWAERPEETLSGGQWQPATSEHVGSFTAVGYYFARALRRHVDVPIGLVNSTWGGSRIEPWMSASALGLDSADVQSVLQEEENRVERLREGLRETLGGLPDQDRGMVDGEPRWADPALDDGSWTTVQVPRPWEEAGYNGLDGVAWYRRTVELNEGEASQSLTLHLGPIDDADVTWVNGTEVGRTSGYTEPRTYDVPASVLRPGDNVIAVRVEDNGGGGGIYGEASTRRLSGTNVEKELAGPWRFRVGRVSIDAENRKNQVPTVLYNKMVHPLLSYPIKGVLWYQGESNANTKNAAAEYRTQFQHLISQWRTEWDHAAERPFPFLWVQLANYMEPSETPQIESTWALLRESQHSALSLPKTGQAVAIDLGEAEDIHPRNKQDVGRRLARDARAVAYGYDVAHSGPVYANHRIEEGRVVVSFDHVDGGLTTRNGAAPGGFVIAGPDRNFVWANAAIRGGEVVVWSDEVDEPVAVRYAWADNPDRANLYNEAGLPAAPFRTDDW